MANWREMLIDPSKLVLIRAGDFLMTFLGVVLILIVGWVVAKVVETLVVRIGRLVKLDQLSEKSGLSEFLAKGDVRLSLVELIGAIVYWIVLLAVLVTALNALGLTVAADLLDKIVLYVPNVVASIFILILGIFVATLVGGVIRTAAANAGLVMANGLARVAQAILILFSIAIALSQLNIRTTLVDVTISIIVGSIGLAFALAFGLGCKDIAAKYLNEVINHLSGPRR